MAIFACLVALFAFAAAACHGGRGGQGGHGGRGGHNGHHNGYQYGAWELTTAPACDTAGEQTRVCLTDPTKTEIRTVEPTGHEWGEFTTQSEPTCLVAGFKTRVCSEDANHIDKQPIAPLGHSYTVWTVTIPATCLTAGSEKSVCDRDITHKSTQAITALGHDFGEFLTLKAPTCENMGVEESTCLNDCEHTKIRNTPALGHDYNDFTTTVLPTCNTKGEQTSICQNDHTHTKTKEIPALGHNFGEWVTIDTPTESKNGEEIRVCSNNKAHTESNVLYATGTLGAFNFSLKDGEYSISLKDRNTEEVVIPAYYNGLSVTKIASSGFLFSQIKTVDFAEGSNIKSIGDSAFMDSKLERIYLPEGLEYIASDAFSFTNLTSVIIPDSVSDVEYCAFGLSDYVFGLSDTQYPLFIYIRGGEQQTAGWAESWNSEDHTTLVTYNSDYQYGDAHPAYHTINYNIEGGGTIYCVEHDYNHYHSDGTAIYGYILAGEDCMTVEARATSGYRFVGWSDGVLTAERTDHNITSDLEVTAIFEVDL